ncbi:glycoside hydrolase family 11 protein [Natronobiforma cellulositropha]|uniref:glycoside hydrolase family 11 protein n=1 Tax=Natronobiforma cellulositropha TaxID=1679076 RepID=UPI0021D5A73E|nr:glycoside hydrolase family 11 protein [Natronobiforma cellulositropha]
MIDDCDTEATSGVEETTEQRTELPPAAKRLRDFQADLERPSESAESGSVGRRGFLRTVGAAAATGLGAGAMATSAVAQETLTENTQTEHDGHFVSFWTDTPDTVSMTLESGGSYSCEWNNTGNFVLGKGWNPGSSRTIEYDATHNPTDNSYLCLYGWTTDPLVEYYIIENYGTYRPGDEQIGSHESDGSTYELATSERIQEPSIEGTATFTQYWSIRENSRTSGTISIGNHFDAWESAGLPLGNHDYQIMAVEAWGYSGSNSASVTISESDGGGSGGIGGGDPGGEEPGDDTGSEEPETGDQEPYGGTPHAIPGRIQAEEYDEGGPDVAYSDNTSENEGGAMRTDQYVDISSGSGGSGYSIGHIEAGEWVEYTVDVTQSGEYTVDALVASDSDGGAFNLEVGGQDISGDVSFGATGGWDTWETVSTSGVSLSAGQQVIRVSMNESWWDLNYLEFSLDGSDDGSDSGGDDDTSDDDQTDDGTTGDAQAWDSGEVYTEGDRVSYDGSTWEAQWWTHNEQPGGREYGPWEEVGTSDGGSGGDTGGSDGDTGGSGGDTGGSGGDAQAWDAGEVYTDGDRVSYDGSTWEAQWYTQSQEPGATPWGPWEEV